MATEQATRPKVPPTTGMLLAVYIKVCQGIEEGNPDVVPYLDHGAVWFNGDGGIDFDPERMAYVIGAELAQGRW